MKTILLISPYWKEPHRWMVSTVKLAELWQRIGYRVVVVCMGHYGKQERQESRSGDSKIAAIGQEIVSPTLTIYRVPDIFLKDPWNYGIAFGFSGKVMRVVRSEKPDVIVVNKILFWSSIALLRLRLAGHKVLLITDALVGITWWPRGKIARICSAIYAWTLGWMILHAASKVVFFHPQPEKILKKLGIAKKSQVIPTGIDSASFGLRAMSDEQLTATYVGRLESVKGVDDFVAAATEAQKNHPALKIQVAGWYPSTSPGQARHPLVDQYKDRVKFLGLRDDISAILQSSDIFVLPSYSEGLSNALMEAMASGCACIATDVGGNVFLIQNGVSGFLYPAGDRKALASHIRRLIEDPAKRKALGAGARKRIEQEFDWTVVGEKYRRLFEEFSASDR